MKERKQLKIKEQLLKFCNFNNENPISFILLMCPFCMLISFKAKERPFYVENYFEVVPTFPVYISVLHLYYKENSLP